MAGPVQAGVSLILGDYIFQGLLRALEQENSSDVLSAPQVTAVSGKTAIIRIVEERYFPESEVMVIGHFHWPGCWRIRGKLVINTGTFVNPSAAHWVEWSGGLLRRGKVIEKNGGCRMGEALDVWRLK